MSIKAQRIPSVNSSICKIFSKSLPSKIYHGRIILRKGLVYVGGIGLVRPQMVTDQMVSAVFSWRLISAFYSIRTLLLKVSFFPSSFPSGVTHSVHCWSFHVIFVRIPILKPLKNTERFAVLWGDSSPLGSRSLAHAEGASWKAIAQKKPFLQRKRLWPGLVNVRLRHTLLILAKD